MIMSMFDQKPVTTAVTAVAAVNNKPENTRQRGLFHYIENIYDPKIHQPQDANVKYIVPKENELVFDVTNGVIYRVEKVDWQGDLTSTLIPWVIMNTNSDNTSEQDWIFGLRGGPMNGEALLAIDYSVRPNVARVDSTIMRPGAAYAKLYLGNVTKDDNTVISAQYDKSSNMITNKVPCKLAEIVDRTNLNIMTTDSFSVTLNGETLTDGTRCTLVFFDEGGNFIPPAQPVMVQHAAFMKDHQIGIRYVDTIELLSPWFTNINDPERIIVPINTNIQTIEFRAAVHFSNGETEIHPVNGDKFTLYGLNEHRPHYPGQEGELVLRYRLDEGEQVYLAQPGAPNHKTRTYAIEAGAVMGAYSPKLYTIPYWDAKISGYSLKHYLYDLDRTTRIDVTDKVKLNDQSPAYSPSKYGVEQNLIFNLNLKDVNPTNHPVVFRQYTDVTLFKDMNGTGKRWSARYTLGKPAYENKFIKAKNNGKATTINLVNGYKTLDEWLAGLYLAVDPAIDVWSETKAITPNAFYILNVAGNSWRYNVSDWNKDLPIDVEIQRGGGYFIAWVFRDTSGAEQQLAMTGMVGDV